VTGPAQPAPDGDGTTAGAAPLFDRKVVLDQLGGWRGMVDATLPTIAFIVANSLAGLRPGIYAALVAAALVFVLRLVRRESLQQAVSGLFGVAIAVAIAAWSGQARDFFVVGIVRSAGIAVLLGGSIAVRRPLVGYAAEFFAPSHLGAMAAHSLTGLLRRREQTPARPARPQAEAEPAPERHWREDPRALRAYSWLTALWAASFALRAAVQGLFYRRDDVELLGTASVVLGLPVTAVCVLVTLWVVARLHRHRAPADPPAQ
jgi:Protein of unknown function (DUF3159)